MRRRRNRGTWFPTLGTDTSDPDGFNFSGRQFGFTLTGFPQVVITPVVMDEPLEGENAGTGLTLSDFIGNEYVLQRIVGKVFAARYATLLHNATNQVDRGKAAIFGCGFFVARAQDADTGDSEQPIGSNSAAERNDNYNPLDIDTVREPWIWRRTWILGSAGRDQVNGDLAPTTAFLGTQFANSVNLSAAVYPASTALYGSVMDGPHVDSKVKRRVRQDERLFFAVAASLFPFGLAPDENEPVGIAGTLDLRVFGSLRAARNSSSF